MISFTHEQADDIARRITAARIVLIADEAGIESLITVAQALHHAQRTPLVFAESNSFTQRLRPSTILVPGMPAGVIATFTFLDQQGIPARLCCPLDLPGCYDGSVTDLARAWLNTLDSAVRSNTVLFVCGTTRVQELAAQLAHEMGIEYQPLRA